MRQRVAVLAMVMLASGFATPSPESPAPVAETGSEAAPEEQRGAYEDPHTAASCVEAYAPARVARRAFAFEVHEWFVGSSGTEFTADFTDVPLRTRLLVSGEDRWDEGAMKHPIVWSCGFTRY